MAEDALVAPEALRRQVRLPLDDDSQDEDLADCLGAAVGAFQLYTHRVLVADGAEESSPENVLVVDAEVRRALLIGVAHFFEHRGDADVPMPKQFFWLADPHRWRDL